jgi:hypothetical protein
MDENLNSVDTNEHKRDLGMPSSILIISDVAVLPAPGLRCLLWDLLTLVQLSRRKR